MSIGDYQKYGKKYYDANKLETRTIRQSKKQYKEKKLVICRICNETVGVKGISIHLQRLHNINFVTYLRKYLDDFVQYGWKWCDNCNKEPARNFASSKKKWATCSMKCSAEFRSKQTKGKAAWNKGITMSDDYKQKLSILRKGRIGTPHTEETKVRLSLIKKKEVENGTWINPATKKSMNNLEILASNILSAGGYEYTSQFFITTPKKKTYSYDFKLHNLPILIEIDGDYWHGGPGKTKHAPFVDKVRLNDVAKTEAAKERGYKLVRMWESELKQTPELLVERIRESHNI